MLRCSNEHEKMTSLQKVWAVLFPYLLYYLAYSAVYIMLAFIQEVLMGSQNESWRKFMTQHDERAWYDVWHLSAYPHVEKGIVLARRHVR